jgi:hypothetical protein
VTAEPVVAAIETRYAGCRFRSRLEARWAVVLDAAGFRWEYEPEGFETPYGHYLPDFRIHISPTEMWWLEVKPDNYELSDHDLGRWVALTRSTESVLAAVSGLDRSTIIVTFGHTYAHPGRLGFIRAEHVEAGRSARFEHQEGGG